MTGKPRRLRTMMLEALTVVAMGGCTTWRSDPGGISPALEKKPAKLRITRVDSSNVVVSAPRLAGDTLVGHDGDRQKTAVRIPADSILRVESRGVDGANTAALVGGVGLLVVVGVVAAQNAVETGLGNSLGQ